MKIFDTCTLNADYSPNGVRLALRGEYSYVATLWVEYQSSSARHSIYLASWKVPEKLEGRISQAKAIREFKTTARSIAKILQLPLVDEFELIRDAGEYSLPM